MTRPRLHDKLSEGARIVAILTIALVVVTSVDQNAVLAQTPFGASRVSPETGFMGWLLAQQAVFYRALSGAVRHAKTDGSALWTLMGIAFAYGVFHAAGPGHGKAVISSYLLANDETWRRGIALSFTSALLQSLTAVLIVGIAAALLGATAQMMSAAARTIELISYGLIVLLGARLLWVKGLGFIRALAEFRDHRHHRVDDAPNHHPAVAHVHHAHHIMVMTAIMPMVTITIIVMRTATTTSPTCFHGGTPMAPSRKISGDRAAGSAVCQRLWPSACGLALVQSFFWCLPYRRGCFGRVRHRPS